MSKSEQDLQNIYESMLIQEMNIELIEYLNDNKEDLPFSHIFGETDLRITIPVMADPMANNIANALKKIKDYDGIDLESGEIIRKIKLDPKYGGGEKEQRMKIASAIYKLKIPDEEKKEYLDWFALYKDNLADNLAPSKYTIILSRAPIDVIRMSDFDNNNYRQRIASCHSQGGQYFECAVQEAINGGAVAFLVDSDDLKMTLDNGYTLNDEELFTDFERYPNDDDFSPIARLRVRKLDAQDGREFAIPDKKIYGDNTIPGFYANLRNFLRREQPMSEEDFWQFEWEKRGGTYYDSDINTLIDYYFDSNDNDLVSRKYGILHNKDDRSIERDRKIEISRPRVQQLENECEDIKDSANRRMSYCNVEFSVEISDGEPYIYPGAHGTYSLSDLDIVNHNISDLSLSINDPSEYNKYRKGNYDDSIIWSGLLNWLFERNSIRLSRLEIENGEIEFDVYIDNVVYDTNEYDSFADAIIDFDNYLSRLDDTDWTEALEEIGLISPSSLEALEYMIENASHDLSYDDSYGDRNVEWDLTIDSITNETLETYKDATTFGGGEVSRNMHHMGDTFTNMLITYLMGNYKPKQEEVDDQLSFKNFFESYHQSTISSEHRMYLYDLNIDKILVNVKNNRDNTIIFTVRINIDNFNPENVDVILFLDRNLNDVRNMAAYAYLLEHRYIETNNPKYSNYLQGLKRVYGKYINNTI